MIRITEQNDSERTNENYKTNEKNQGHLTNQQNLQIEKHFLNLENFKFFTMYIDFAENLSNPMGKLYAIKV